MKIRHDHFSPVAFVPVVSRPNYTKIELSTSETQQFAKKAGSIREEVNLFTPNIADSLFTIALFLYLICDPFRCQHAASTLSNMFKLVK